MSLAQLPLWVTGVLLVLLWLSGVTIGFLVHSLRPRLRRDDLTIACQLAVLGDKIDALTRKGDVMALDLTALAAEVARNTEVDASSKALMVGLGTKVQDLKDQLAAAIGAGTVTAEDLAALQALADTLKTDNDSLAAAVVANTPAG